MSRSGRSWLDGPEIPAEFDDQKNPAQWPGQKLGLPKQGKGSLVSVARRSGGVFIDWMISGAIAVSLSNFTHALGDVATSTWLIFIILGFISVWLFARTPGQAMLGMGVARVDQGGVRVGCWRSALRSILTAFILPAAMVDQDGRGLHDKATGTAVIRG